MDCNQLNLISILRSIQAMMGCFLGCFRIKDVRKPPTPPISDESSTHSSEDNWVSGNNLATLFIPEEKQDWSSDSTTYKSMVSCFQDSDNKELKDEAKFLKACGAILETPAEIRAVSDKVEVSASHDGDFQPSEFHFWLPNSPIKKLHWEEQAEWVPDTAATYDETLGKGSDSPQHIPISLESEEQEVAVKEDCELEIPYATTDNKISAVTPDRPTQTTRKNKFVRFEVRLDTDQNLEQSNSSGSETGSSNKVSYPTPTTITDEMQTPGTIYPSNQKSLNTKIRSQYVRTILKPIDNFSQWDVLKKQDVNTQKQLGHAIRSLNQHEKVKARACDMDRPILGIVALHWNDEEASRVEDKVVVGNGIPNSTRKYKEDQRISWHATPFEERLEKALSEEALISQRRVWNASPINFDENEECFSG